MEVEQKAITVGQLIKVLGKLPSKYAVHINIAGRVIGSITGAEDIGGDYFGQVFLTNFEVDPEEQATLQPVEKPDLYTKESERERGDYWKGQAFEHLDTIRDLQAKIDQITILHMHGKCGAMEREAVTEVELMTVIDNAHIKTPAGSGYETRALARSATDLLEQFDIRRRGRVNNGPERLSDR